MSSNLTVAGPISDVVQPVSSQDGQAAGLLIAKQTTEIRGQDVAGKTLPLIVTGTSPAKGTETYNRIFRLAFAGSNFFDFGIDKQGSLVINTGASGADAPPVLSISKSGDVTINGNVTINKKLTLPQLQTAPGGSRGLAVDGSGVVYKQ
jgi:hypothetical protein